MPSVLGLLEAREKKVRAKVVRLREEAERIRAALSAAEVQLVKFPRDLGHVIVTPQGRAGVVAWSRPG